MEPNLSYLIMDCTDHWEIWLHCEGYHSVVPFQPTDITEKVLADVEEACFNLPCTLEDTDDCIRAISDNLAPIQADAKV